MAVEVGIPRPISFCGACGRRPKTGNHRGWPTQVGKGFAGEIAKNQRPQIIGDLLRQPDMRPSGSKGVEALQSLIGIPLISRDELVGVLVGGSVTRDAFSTEDLNLLNMVSEPAAAALANARRFQDEQRRWPNWQVWRSWLRVSVLHLIR